MAHDQAKANMAEKWLAKEEGCSSGEEASRVTPARGEDNPESSDRNPESGTCNPKLGNCNPEPVPMDVNMVFTILAEFRVPTKDVMELALGAERVVFGKPKNPGSDMKPLFIRGHLDETPIGHMLVDGGASVNILPLSLFKKLGHIKGDLKCTNLSLSGFACDPTEAKCHIKGDLKRTNLSLSGFACYPTEAKCIIYKEVTIGSKTVPTTFFVVDVKGHYNVLLGRDWIHANECVPSTLHQCVMQ
jgi:hypothetical protein